MNAIFSLSNNQGNVWFDFWINLHVLQRLETQGQNSRMQPLDENLSERFIYNNIYKTENGAVVNRVGNQPGIVLFDGGDVEASEKHEII